MRAEQACSDALILPGALNTRTCSDLHTRANRCKPRCNRAHGTAEAKPPVCGSRRPDGRKAGAGCSRNTTTGIEPVERSGRATGPREAQNPPTRECLRCGAPTTRPGEPPLCEECWEAFEKWKRNVPGEAGR